MWILSNKCVLILLALVFKYEWYWDDPLNVFISGYLDIKDLLETFEDQVNIQSFSIQ